MGDFAFHLGKHLAAGSLTGVEGADLEVITLTASVPAQIAIKHALKHPSEREGMYELYPGFKVIGPVEFGFFQKGKIATLISRLHPDAVLVQYPSKGYGWALGAPLMGRTVAAAARRTGRKIPMIAVVHEYQAAHPLRRLAISELVKSASAVVTPCLEESEALRRRFGIRPHVIPDGNVFGEEIRKDKYERIAEAVSGSPDAKALRASLPALFNELYSGIPLPGLAELDAISEVLSWKERNRNAFFSYGLMVPAKDPLTLLAAFDETRRNAPGARLVLASGLNPYRGFQKLVLWYAERMGVTDGILFTGHLPPEMLKLMAEKCALQVYTFKDGFSTKRSSVISALSFNTPILTQYRSGTPPPPLDVVEPGDYRELADSISRVLTMHDGDYRGYLNRQLDVQSRYAREFAFERIAEQYRDVVLEAAGAIGS